MALIILTGMKYLRDLTIEEMKELCVEMGEKPFRAKQIFSWLYKGQSSVQSIDEMANLPAGFREALKGGSGSDSEIQQRGQDIPGEQHGAGLTDEQCEVGVLRVLAHQTSAKDGTEKYLFELYDGNAVESVLMKYDFGNSVCVSTQAGCRMGCSFCASGINGLVRDLAAGEIVSQVIDVMRNSKVKVSHVVFMGTGEPFDNYENVSKAIRILNEPLGLNMSMRNITVSTSGLVQVIERFAEDFPQVNLAISLHAPNDEIRRGIMPIAKAYPLDELIAACDSYVEKTNRRVTFEYALIRDVNDSDACMHELADLLKGHLAHVNLIPLNEVYETGLRSSGRERAMEFKKYLEDHGVPASVRRELGSDIDGACGQLRNKRL